MIEIKQQSLKYISDKISYYAFGAYNENYMRLLDKPCFGFHWLSKIFVNMPIFRNTISSFKHLSALLR